MSLTPSISEELTSRAPPRPIVAWTAIRTRRPPRSDSSWHQRRKTRKKRKGWRREKKKNKTLFYDSNFMENSISFLWGGGGCMEIPRDSAHSASPFIEFQSGHHPQVRIKSIQNQLSKSSKYCTHAFVFINLLHLYKIPCYLVRNEQSRVKRLGLFQPLKHN